MMKSTVQEIVAQSASLNRRMPLRAAAIIALGLIAGRGASAQNTNCATPGVWCLSQSFQQPFGGATALGQVFIYINETPSLGTNWPITLGTIQPQNQASLPYSLTSNNALNWIVGWDQAALHSVPQNGSMSADIRAWRPYHSFSYSQSILTSVPAISNPGGGGGPMLEHQLATPSFDVQLLAGQDVRDVMIDIANPPQLDGTLEMTIAAIELPRSFDIAEGMSVDQLPFADIVAQAKEHSGVLSFELGPGESSQLMVPQQSIGNTLLLAIRSSRLGESDFVTTYLPLIVHPDILVGDFDVDGTLSAADVDLMSQALIDGTADSVFDLNMDGIVDRSDRESWIHDIRQTVVGDANLDGRFDSTDLVQVFSIAKFEDGTSGNAGWSDGDWNGDLDFDTSDLVYAFQSGSYDVHSAVAAVPEPAGSLWLAFAIFGFVTRARIR